MHVFKHPKYYKELRERNKLDQAISTSGSTECSDKRAPGPGHKPQASDKLVNACVDQSARSAQEPGAASDKPQAKK
jgi:hypothetical protein